MKARAIPFHFRGRAAPRIKQIIAWLNRALSPRANGAGTVAINASGEVFEGKVLWGAGEDGRWRAQGFVWVEASPSTLTLIEEAVRLSLLERRARRPSRRRPCAAGGGDEQKVRGAVAV